MSTRARLLFAVFMLLTAALCTRLGFWQLSRLRERRARNAELAAGRALAPVRLPGVAAPEGRAVEAIGAYDHDREFVVRGQVVREVPGVLVVTPLRLAGSDSAVLVLRGYVPSADARTVSLDSLREPGEQVVRGVAEAIAATGAEASTGSDGRTTVRRIALDAARLALPYPVLGVLVRQLPAEGLPALPRRLEARPLDDGPHRNYAIQWFAFAVTALVVGGVVALRRDGEAPAVPG